MFYPGFPLIGPQSLAPDQCRSPWPDAELADACLILSLPIETQLRFAVAQRQLADAQNRLNSQRASSGDGEGAAGGGWGPGDSVLDLLRDQASI